MGPTMMPRLALMVGEGVAPRLESEEKLRMPWETVRVPVKALVAARVTEPGPILVMPKPGAAWEMMPVSVRDALGAVTERLRVESRSRGVATVWGKERAEVVT